MNTVEKFFILAATILPLVFSCTAEMPDAGEGSSSPIMFSMKDADIGLYLESGSSTRGFLYNDNFHTSGTAVQVFGVHHGTSSTEHIPGIHATSDGTGGNWPLMSDGEEQEYYWKGYGTHTFYGILSHDAHSQFQTPGMSYTEGSIPTYGGETADDWGWGYADNTGDIHIFHIPQPASSSDAATLTLLPSSDQFDFVYSDVVVRNMENSEHRAAVNLSFNHLFSAFAFMLTNDSPDNLTLTNVQLNVWNTANASLDYRGAWESGSSISAPEKTYRYGADATEDSSSAPSDDPIAGIAHYADGITATIGAGVTADLFNVSETSEHCRLAWPQSLQDKTLTLNYSATMTMDVFSYPQTSGHTPYYVSAATYSPGSGSYLRGSYSDKGFTADADQQNGSGKYFCFATKENGGNSAGFGDWDVVFTSDENSRDNDYYSIGNATYVAYAKTSTSGIERDYSKNISLAEATDADGNAISEWEPGRKYTYRLKYLNNKIESLSAEVTNWQDSENTVKFE